MIQATIHWGILALRYFTLCLATLIAATGSVVAQDDTVRMVTVTGVVRNAVSKRPVPFAIVSVEGTQVSALSGSDGRYRLRLRVENDGAGR